MKNKLFASMLIVFSLTAGTVIPAYASNADKSVIILNIGKPTMLVNGVEKNIDSGNQVAPVLINDTTMVPIRAIVESMGGSLEWDSNEQKVTITYNNNKVEVWIDRNTALVNGKETNIAVAPATINDRTMLPLRFISESLGLCVNWEGSSEAISIAPSNDYMAVAGGQIVSKTEYSIFLTVAKNDIYNILSQKGVISSPNSSIWDNQINNMRAGDLARKYAMDYSIKHSLLLGKAKELNLTLNENELAAIEANVSQMIQAYGDKSTAEKTINNIYGVSLAEYSEFMKENELVKKYLGSLSEQINISDAEIAKVFDIYKPVFDKVTVQHILISTLDSNKAPISAEKQEEARLKAEDILSKVKAGQDFAALAKQYSEDPGSKDSGGIYTFTSQDNLVQEFKDWSFQAKSGDTGIIKTVFGYHVMKFLGRSTEDEIRSSIRNELVNEGVRVYINNIVSDNSSVTVINQGAYNAIEVK